MCSKNKKTLFSVASLPIKEMDMAKENVFGNYIGVELISVKETTCLTKLVISDNHLSSNGEVSIGVLPAIANVTMEYLNPFFDKKGQTVEQECNYIHTIKLGDVLEAQGSVMPSMKSTGVYQVAISNQTGEVVFWMKGTFK